MFRAAAPAPFDEAVAKATDENATSEDWAAILEVCDRVSADAANGPKEAVQSLIKRLAHRNANVQLYTLELANALSQNCGTPLHRELASRAFTDALLKLANDRNTHNLVRLKILERMKEWSDMFRSNTDLGIMQDAYARLQQAQPQLHPPSAPQKNSLTDQDRQREEEDLQRALKLSLEDETEKKAPAAASAASAAASSSAAPSGPSSGPVAGAAGAAGASAAGTGAPPAPGTTAATVSRVRALFDFAASEPDELDFKKGDVIAVIESVYRDWWRGSVKGRSGIFPLNYVEILADPTPDELQREAQMEAEVFAEIKNVEKLLTLLSASNTAPREEDSDEISKLYHQTLAIRPKLIKLIEKYSQKKDDFTQLNEKFIKARRDYEALLESSMAHPPQPNYQQYAMRPPIPTQSAYNVYPTEQRYYTPGPQRQEKAQYPQSPSPNYQRPGTAPVGAPFYIATDLGHQQSSQQQAPPPQQQQQQPPPQQLQQPPQQPQPIQQHQHSVPQQQQAPYPTAQNPQASRLPSVGSVPGVPKQPSPLHTSSSTPPISNSYLPYHPPQQQASTAPSGPHSTYGNPQELSTSAYDSPVASHNPVPAGNDPNSAATYSSSVYSPDQFAPPAIPSNAPPSAPVAVAPSEPSAPPPSTIPYPPNSYNTYQQPPSQAPSAPYGAAPSAPEAPAPAPLTSSPPPIAPAALQPGSGNVSNSYYDARQTLPSRIGAAPSAPSAPSVPAPSAPGASVDQPQYRAYVPPAEPAQTSSTPPVDDYYRQASHVSGY